MTIDEFDDLYNIPMRARLNGKTVAEGTSGGQLWNIEEVLAFISLGEYIQPGDVIGSGTMGGGSALELDIWLKPGDVIEIEADGVGTLRNTFGELTTGLWWPETKHGVLIPQD